jgi:phosphatidylserine decarboxylase
MIARDGLTIILVLFVLTVALIFVATRFDSRASFGLSILFGLFTLFSLFFFRDPNRAVPAGEGILVAPADGKIVAIEQLRDHPHIGGPATKISIFLSVFDVHINRVPVSGTIEYVDYHPGKFIAAYEDKASDINERTEIGMTAASGQKIVVKQIAGLIARRIVCRLEMGDVVATGDRFGMIKFGSRTDLIIPGDSRVEVSMGQHVAGGTTIMGYLGDGSTRMIQEGGK